MQWTENNIKTNWQRIDQHNEFIDIQTTSVSQSVSRISSSVSLSSKFVIFTEQHELMRMSQLNNCTVYSEMLLGNDLDNFHNFFHQLLMLWIIHVVLSLMSRLVHIFLSTMLSFVSTSSLTVFVFPQVLRSQSGCCWCFASRTQAPHSRIIGSKIAHRASNTSIIAFCSITQYPVSIDQSPIRSEFSRLAIDQPSTCFPFPDFTNSFSNSIRLVFLIH